MSSERAEIRTLLENNPTVTSDGKNTKSIERLVQTIDENEPFNTTPPRSQGKRRVKSSPKQWDDTGTLPGGIPVGKHGAHWHILDETGEKISRGWQMILPIDDGFACKRGAHWYHVSRRDVSKQMQWVEQEPLDRPPSSEDLISTGQESEHD